MVNESSHTAPFVKRYRTLVGITIGAVLLLMLVGGIVRTTGSGMGCPDWPTCFGEWIPPTDVSELPSDYKTRFRVAGREVASFDAFKTWIEYLNRLLGVLVGLCAILTLAAAWPFLQQNRPVFWYSLLGLILICIEGGIGAYVVKTHLHTGMITLHMGVALAVLAVYIRASLQLDKIRQDSLTSGTRALASPLLWGVGMLMLLTVAQIFMGTQVREQIDVIAGVETARSTWISQLSGVYSFHKYGYYLLLAGAVWVYVKLRPYRDTHKHMIRLALGILLLMGAEALVGIVMHNFAMPAALQPLHLLLASALFGAEFALLGKLYLSGKEENSKRKHDSKISNSALNPS